MKNKIKVIFLLTVLAFLGVNRVDALIYSAEDLPNGSYVIGTMLYTRDKDKLTGYKGYLTTDLIVQAASYSGIHDSIIDNGALGAYILELLPINEIPTTDSEEYIPSIIYKDAFGNLKDALTGKTFDSTFYHIDLTHINNVKIIGAPSLFVDMNVNEEHKCNDSTSTCLYNLSFNHTNHLLNSLNDFFEGLNEESPEESPEESLESIFDIPKHYELYEVLDINSIDFIGDGTTVNIIDEDGIKLIGESDSTDYNGESEASVELQFGETKIYLTKLYYDLSALAKEEAKLESVWGVEVISAGLKVNSEEIDGKYVLSSNIDLEDIDSNVELTFSPVGVYSKFELDPPKFTDWLNGQDNDNIDLNFEYFTEKYYNKYSQINPSDIFYRTDRDNVIFIDNDIYLETSYITEEEDEEIAGKYYLYARVTDASEIVKDDFLFALQFEYKLTLEDEEGNEYEQRIPFRLISDDIGIKTMPIQTIASE